MDFLLNNNDIKIQNGDLVICRDNKQALIQAIKIRLKTLKGEWFLDTNIGIPYFSEVFGNKRSEQFIKHILISEIENFSNIKSVSNFNIELDKNRIATIKFNIELEDQSTINFKEQIGI